jgi:hypothetical protein
MASLNFLCCRWARTLKRARRRLHELRESEAAPEEKLCREQIRRFRAAINGADLPAIVKLLAGEQPVSVCESPQLRIRAGASANDASYRLALAA